MRTLVAALLIVVGCGKADDKPAAKPGSVASTTTTDPWNVPAKSDPDGLPSIGERAKLADEACPKVTAPFFFALTKNGKTSFFFGFCFFCVGLLLFLVVVG